MLYQTIKFLGSTKNKITKDKKEDNVSHLKITKVVLGYCHIVNNDYQTLECLAYICSS